MAEWSPGAVPPGPMQISSWQQAELNAARWMRHWGYADATASPGGPDAGIDVRSARALGQVKYQAAQVGRPELQRFVGARPYGSTAQLIFFTGSDYAPTAMAYAKEWNIALFRYRLDGAMTPANEPARRVLRSARSSGPSPAAPSPAARPAAPQGAAPTFWGRNWRVIVGVSLLLAPIGSIGDEKTYTGPLIVDVLKFLGILVALWAIGGYLIATRFGVRVALRTRPLRVALDRPAAPATAPPAPVPRPRRESAASGALVAEAAALLRGGSKQHHVDRILKERGVGFMERGHVLTEARKLNKRP
ncbi:restriction endonuclease [Streptomyces sp. NPDC088785]|uniref:restriction endonuclease n=1 Tax=Streptomyces sp. NPDC088785 TaxID=3365897 RepID=UPI003820CA47